MYYIFEEKENIKRTGQTNNLEANFLESSWECQTDHVA